MDSSYTLSLQLLVISILLCCNCALSTPAELEPTCQYDGHFPANSTPWTALIRPSTTRQKFVAAIINNTTILSTGEAFRDDRSRYKFKMLPFENYTIQIGLHRSDHKDFVQVVNITYIKPHPDLPRTDQLWPNFLHNWVIVYLKEPINFTKGVGPLCLPTRPLVERLVKSTSDSVKYLRDVLIHGPTKHGTQQEFSYYVKLNSSQNCHDLWKRNPITTRFNYEARVCGNISRPAENNACIRRPSGTALEENHKWYLIGFLNSRTPLQVKCDKSTVTYISLIMPGDLEWIQNNLICGPRKFSCDNGTKCLELKFVCDGKTHQCADGSDQKSFYCDGLTKCNPKQFTCSTGLAAYCIPKTDPLTGKVARNCDGMKDCPGGEDEDALLCASKFPMIWIYIGIGITAFFIAVFSVSVAIYGRKSRRDLTLEELIDFFEGERHLQTEEHSMTEIDTNNSLPEYANLLLEVEPLHQTTLPEADAGVPNAQSADSILDFCPEIVRARGYDASLDFDVRNPAECTIGPQIGHGSFGVIKKGFVHGRAAAIKYPNVSIEVNAFKVLLLELKILKYIQDTGGEIGHPNIVKFIGADTQRVRQRILYIALEFCENGNLEDYIGFNRARFQTNICGPPVTGLRIDPQRPRYSTVIMQDAPMPTSYPLHSECLQRLIRWAEQIASGMKFLSHKILHLDLAARNVLLDSNLVAKVGDFGLSRRVYENVNYKIKRKDPLPFQWLALEILTTHKCSPNSDIWSYGVTIWELFSLCEQPWQGTDHRELTTKLCNGHRLNMPKYANLDIYEQMRACWNEKPDQRPSFGELEAFFHTLI